MAYPVLLECCGSAELRQPQQHEWDSLVLLAHPESTVRALPCTISGHSAQADPRLASQGWLMASTACRFTADVSGDSSGRRNSSALSVAQPAVLPWVQHCHSITSARRSLCPASSQDTQPWPPLNRCQKGWS